MNRLTTTTAPEEYRRVLFLFVGLVVAGAVMGLVAGADEGVEYFGAIGGIVGSLVGCFLGVCCALLLMPAVLLVAEVLRKVWSVLRGWVRGSPNAVA